ncbi:MAG: metallophosphoesterase family protein [Smithellaceae bacterium]|nr:metallophosphoesterase family protein [Smithellaceae bacterium]
MMAVISDIHGNFPALQAVLHEIEKSGCNQIISLGDVAGYYCQINECIEILRQKNIPNILGNHDYYLANNQPCPRSNAANVLLRYQREHITSGHLEWLRNSAPKMEFCGTSFVHGGWKDPLDEYLTEVSEEYFRNEHAKHFFSGHTHIQSLSQVGSICHCNPGSVGQPRDNDPKAAFAFFDGKNIYLRRVDYDIDRMAAAMKDCGFDRYFYEGLYTGRKIGVQRADCMDHGEWREKP